jgi:hypothetical protein
MSVIEQQSCTEEVLERCLMPREEIARVVEADDPAVVHMLLELHAERLREELADRLAALDELDARLAAHTTHHGNLRVGR